MMRRVPDLKCWSLILGVAILVVPSIGAEQSAADIGFESEDWTITSGRIVDHLGRRALAGSAALNGVDFTDGIIEVDIAMDGRRCFPGIIFRAESDADTEIFYLRPHRSKNYSHALQYTPRFKGLTGWQLYSGPGFTANIDIPLDRWVHLKLEIKGTRARIYFDDMASPALVVGDLKRGTAGGFIGVSAPGDGRVHFSNFRFSTDEALEFGPQPIRAVTPGGVTGWEISQPIVPRMINRDLSPHAQELGEIKWQKVTADDEGLVDVARFLNHVPQLPQCVLARTTITAEYAERRKLLFGYSDEISVFLNGLLLFRGDSSFRARDDEFMGVVGLNDAIVLDLKAGENELLFVITETFGGWGFMARTESLRTDPVLLADGVTKAWELTEGLMMPESAVWDGQRGHFLVSNINPAGGAAGYGEEGYISRIDTTGKVLEMRWITGLRGPTGVAILDDRLYAVERTGVAIIDLENAEIIDRILIESDGGFLNDIAVSSDGTLFVSDSGLGMIHRVEAGQTSPWVKNEIISGVNGLVVQDGRLVVTTMGSEALVFLGLEDGEIEKIIDLRPFGGDGIMADGADAFLVSDFNGLLLRVTSSGDRTVLIDTREAGISLTDFAFAPEPGLAVIPTLRGNSLQAFDIKVNR